MTTSEQQVKLIVEIAHLISKLSELNQAAYLGNTSTSIGAHGENVSVVYCATFFVLSKVACALKRRLHVDAL